MTENKAYAIGYVAIVLVSALIAKGLSPRERSFCHLLESGAEIETYCLSCDGNRPISVEVHADLARAVSKQS